MNDRPKLLKSRQFHSRVFAVLVIALIFVSQPWLAPESALRQVMLWAGYVLVIIGVLGRVYCSAYIGGRKNDVVVRVGPFSVVRNPLYVFSFLAVVGMCLQSGMLTLAVILPAVFIFYYPLVVAKEEAFLRHKFDASYEVYLREVPRWIPNFKLWVEPEQVTAMPKFIRRTMGDAVWFFFAWPAFLLIAALQSSHIVPVWLTLP